MSINKKSVKKNTTFPSPHIPLLNSLYLEADDSTFAQLFKVITKQAFVYI